MAFTHKCTHTHISRHIHLHMHDTYRDEHTQTCTSTFLTHLMHSIAAIRLDHMPPHLSVSERTSQRDQNKRVEAASGKMMDHSKLYHLTCPAIWLAVFFLTRPCHVMLTSTEKNMKMDLIATLNTLMGCGYTYGIDWELLIEIIMSYFCSSNNRAMSRSWVQFPGNTWSNVYFKCTARRFG